MILIASAKSPTTIITIKKNNHGCAIINCIYCPPNKKYNIGTIIPKAIKIIKARLSPISSFICYSPFLIQNLDHLIFFQYDLKFYFDHLLNLLNNVSAKH